MLLRKLISGTAALIMLGSCGASRAEPAGAADPVDPFAAEVAQVLKVVSAPSFRATVYNIVDYGADASGQNDSLPAINKAMADCAAKGGGRILFPRGSWRADGPVHLKSNMELHLADGARLRFTAEPHYYLPVVLTRWEGTDVYNYSPFIYAFAATNVGITGQGVIDGNAAGTFATWKPRQTADQDRLRKMGIEGTPIRERVFGGGHFLRPNFIQFYACSNVLVEGVRLVDAPFWCLHVVNSNNITVRGVRVESRNLNNDGFDPESSSNILVEDCRFDVGDDGIAIKSGRDQEGWRNGRPTENLVMRRCRIRSDAGAISLGSEMSGGIRNIFIENCTIEDAQLGVYVKGNMDRGGTVEHVRIRAIDIRKVQRKVIQFTSAYHGYRGGKFPPTFRDIQVERLTCDSGDVAISAIGTPESPLRDIVLRDINVRKVGNKNEFAHTENLILENVIVAGEKVTR